MLKKLKNTRDRRENSMLDFVLEMGENCRFEKAQFDNLKDNKRFTREKGKSLLKMSEKIFNGQKNSEITQNGIKRFLEDKENKNPKLTRSSENIKGPEKNLSIINFFKPAPLLKPTPKPKKIEFFDEINKQMVKMSQFNEKDFDFTKSSILPPVKWMKIDNDVLTDDEQLDDALKMMRNNLKEAIKSIQGYKDFISKNISRKIKFVKGK
jgi:hypothetical protein